MATQTVLASALFVLHLSGLFHPLYAQADWQASAYKGWTVTAVKIQGLDKHTASELKNGLALALSKGFLGTTRPIFYPQTLEQDIDRTLLFLTRRGYAHAQVTPSFDPQPKHEELVVILEVDTGPPVIIRSTRVIGMPPLLERNAIELATTGGDSLFVDNHVDRATASLDSLLTYAGHARATVGAKVEWEDSTHVNVRFDVQPGPLYYFGRVSVTGTSDDIVPVVKKTASIPRGTPYSPRILDDAQKNVRLLGLFRQIRLDLEDVVPDTLDVTIDVRMREPRSFETNVRYWTDDGFSGDARWTNRNLFRRGRGLSVTMFGSILRQLFQVSTWWPAVLWPESKAILTVGSIRENEEAYESVSSGTSISLRYEYSTQTMLRGLISVTNEQITSKTPDPDAIPDDDGRLVALNFAWDRYAGNLPIVATEGTVWRGFVEWAPAGKISENHYLLGETTGIVYVPVATRSGLALRLTVGLGRPIGPSTDIIPNKRFYSGGSNSMRGFQRRKLGPLDTEEAPLGGQSKMEGSLEYRFPLPWRFRGTLFVDTGQAWTREPDLDARRIEVAVGPGLWIDTPIGPVRGDLGYRLTNYETSQPRMVFHFSIGPAF